MDYKVLPKEISKVDEDSSCQETRFVVVSATDETKVLDDANGWGYKSAHVAHKSWNFKKKHANYKKFKKHKIEMTPEQEQEGLWALKQEQEDG